VSDGVTEHVKSPDEHLPEVPRELPVDVLLSGRELPQRGGGGQGGEVMS